MPVFHPLPKAFPAALQGLPHLGGILNPIFSLLLPTLGPATGVFPPLGIVVIVSDIPHDDGIARVLKAGFTKATLAQQGPSLGYCQLLNIRRSLQDLEPPGLFGALSGVLWTIVCSCRTTGQASGLRAFLASGPSLAAVAFGRAVISIVHRGGRRRCCCRRRRPSSCRHGRCCYRRLKGGWRRLLPDPRRCHSSSRSCRRRSLVHAVIRFGGRCHQRLHIDTRHFLAPVLWTNGRKA
jgi:hypothetical protein